MRTVLFLLEKEFRQIFRSRQIMAMILVVPILQLVVLANAATFEVKSARLALVDLDRSASSRLLAERFAASGRFRISSRHASLAGAQEDLRRGRVRLVVAIPRDFERSLANERRAPVLLVFDAVDGATAGILSAYAVTILGRFGADFGAEVEARSVSSAAPAANAGSEPGGAVSYWFNPRLSYHDYMVPGILVELVTMVGLLLSALNIVREKEIGTIEQLNVTPLTKGQFIAGKLIPFWILGLVALSLGLWVARLLFHIPIHGSLALIFAIAALYLLVMVGLGLAISTASDTQQQATFLTLFTLIVAILLSGLFTPVDSMPLWAQRLTLANPLYHFIAIMRQVLLQGAGLAAIRVHVTYLAAFAAIILPLAAWRYRKVVV
jgi:ABC-2 type transport system permease protein